MVVLALTLKRKMPLPWLWPTGLQIHTVELRSRSGASVAYGMPWARPWARPCATPCACRLHSAISLVYSWGKL